MRGTVSAGAIVRLLTVCALVTGLFLMHGLPAQACAGGSGMATTAMTGMATSGPGGQAIILSGAPVHGDHAAARPAVPGHGTPCVFTPAPRGLDALLALLLLAATAALAASARPARGTRSAPRSRRAPPRAGPELLATLCVSRT
jgi:hypothetical protein